MRNVSCVLSIIPISVPMPTNMLYSMAEFIEMLRAWKQQRITRLDAETLIALRRWLVGHLLDTDREYAQYYYTHCLSASRPR